jgi:SAM-dependent methyltransferase
MTEGWTGWDDYAPFYDWENARTMGRRDVPFWRRVARKSGGPVLELGCGTGRVLLPIARTGVRVVGVDRSESMLAAARRRLRRSRRSNVSLVRADIRDLPFSRSSFNLIMAPYGVFQSLLGDADLDAALESAAGVLAPGGTLGIDLVADLRSWPEYERRPTLRGRAKGGSRFTLVETVRQDRERGFTIFDQEYVERRRGVRSVHEFSLVFRTIEIAEMLGRLERQGLVADAVLGDYDGSPWDTRADVWLILARR